VIDFVILKATSA